MQIPQSICSDYEQFFFLSFFLLSHSFSFPLPFFFFFSIRIYLSIFIEAFTCARMEFYRFTRIADEHVVVAMQKKMKKEKRCYHLSFYGPLSSFTCLHFA